MVSQKIGIQGQHSPQQARRVLNNYGRSFAFARYFLGAPFNQRATDLYAICRWLDDLADELPCNVNRETTSADIQQQTTIRLSLLNQLKTKIDHPEYCFLLDDGTSLNNEALSILLGGIINDLQAVVDGTPRLIIDQDELINYCHQVAGSVGLLMCDIFGVTDPKAYPHAIALGIAMQLTNISRDFYEDLKEQRQYIPSSWLPTLGNHNDAITVDIKAQDEINQARIRIIDFADRYYQYGIDGISYLPRHCQTAIHLAALIYRGIGVKLKKQINKTPKKRFRVNFIEKLGIASSFKLALVNPYNPDFICADTFIQDQQFTPWISASINRFQELASAINHKSSMPDDISEVTEFDVHQFNDVSEAALGNHPIPVPACRLYWLKSNNNPSKFDSTLNDHREPEVPVWLP